MLNKLEEQPERFNPFTAELVIEPRRSYLLLAFILLSHCAALAVLLTVSGLAFWWRLLLLPIVLLLLFYYAYLHSGSWREKTVRKLYWREFGGWELIDGENNHLPVILQPNSFSRLYLTVLNFRTRNALGSKRYTVILLPDNCSPDIRRRLRMRIKLIQ